MTVTVTVLLGGAGVRPRQVQVEAPPELGMALAELAGYAAGLVGTPDEAFALFELDCCAVRLAALLRDRQRVPVMR